MTFPCHSAATGSAADPTSRKTIVVIRSDLSVTYSLEQPTTIGLVGPYGLHQAVTVNGSDYWLSGYSTARS